MKKLSGHPLNFLLYLEWCLLGLIYLVEFLPNWFVYVPRAPFLNFFCLLILGLMGLKLPLKNQLYKFIYILGESIAIYLAVFVGGVRLFPLIYVIFVGRNCLILTNSNAFLINGLMFGFYGLAQFYRWQNITMFNRLPNREEIGLLIVFLTIIFALLILFLQLFINAVLSEKKSRQELAIAHEQLRRYALRIEDIATLQERNRLAREIHDSLGHSLVGFNLHLEAALRLFAIAPQESRELLIEAKEMSDIALQEVRRSVAKLRTDPLQGKSLQEALAILMQNFQNSTNIIPQLELNLSINLSHEISVAIYRIVQESLTNICKYAKATKVKISLKSDQDLELVILDNGQGFQLEKNSTGFGLQGMKERTIALGGKLKIISDRDQGCKIIVSIPLPKNST